ncbi:hypothetical protein [Phenylobacterium sp.]|uniref:hypothetical protein n=1 Tax=Phenylobacterium sp. TaxID=1871053 RepID=UPI00286C26FB|nr:hypothetical protein [Phenylobacterium sp.]
MSSPDILHAGMRRSGDPRPTPEGLLADPAVSTPLKLVLKAWLRRDPVDAARDAALLTLALERIADEACGLTLDSPRRGGGDDGSWL